MEDPHVTLRVPQELILAVALDDIPAHTDDPQRHRRPPIRPRHHHAPVAATQGTARRAFLLEPGAAPMSIALGRSTAAPASGGSSHAWTITGPAGVRRSRSVPGNPSARSATAS